MKALEQWVIRARSRWRARRPAQDAPPASLTLRLDDLDAPGPRPPASPNIGAWYDSVVRVVEWSGAVPVRVVGRATHPLLPDVVRFAHRLECPTTLRTSAAGLDAAKGEELVDAGVARVSVRVAGVSDAVQRAVLGESAADPDVAIAALLAARSTRVAHLDVVVEIPVDPRAELRAVFERARASGAHGVELAAPWRGPIDAATLREVEWIAAQPRPFNRTRPEVVTALRAMVAESGAEPGAARRGGHCPVAALRLEVAAGVPAGSCPFKDGAVPLGDEAAKAWAALDGHRSAIRSCGRSCAHPDLLPL